MTGVCAVVLAAGEGRRLRPLTDVRPKALCPVGNLPLLDRALARMEALGFTGPAHLAVNASYLGEQVVAHVAGRTHISTEPDGPLGTAGGVGKLSSWIDGRAALVGNADAYLAGVDGLPGLLEDWDGTSVRILGVPGPPNEFVRAPDGTAWRFAGFSLLPWDDVRRLAAEPADLVRTTWRPAEREGRLEVVPFAGTYLDTGTPRDYLAANLDAARDGSLVAGSATVTGRITRAVVGAGAVVHGELDRAVVWPGGVVAAGERLVDAIRVGRDVTVAAS